MTHLRAALDALRANNPSAALDALEQAANAAGRPGATARWASRTILRGMTDADAARVISAIEWALEREDVAA
jgi:hypothetical protein